MSSRIVDERMFTKFMTAQEIDSIVSDLGAKISRDYEGKPLVLITVLKGALVFMADLCRKIKLNLEVDFVRLSSQGKGLTTPGTVSIVKDINVDIRDKHVLIVEEIIDSGRKLKFLYDRLQASTPASIEVVTFLDKKGKRIVETPVKYCGKLIEDQFLIGYGLDLEEKARNLSDLYFLKYPN